MTLFSRPLAESMVRVCIFSILATTICGGCARPMRATEWALWNGESGALQRVPVEVSDATINVRRNEHVVWLLNAGGERRPGGFVDGLSGTPVYSDAGELIGAIANQFWIGSNRAPGALIPADALYDVLREGRIIARDIGPHMRKIGQPQINAGDLIGVLWIWGDLSVGMAGVVALVDGPHAVLFGHHYGADFGATELAVVRTRSVATVALDNTRTIVPVYGDIIGTAYLNSPNGVFAVVGDEARAFRIVVTIEVSGEIHVARYCMARTVGSLDRGIALVLKDALNKNICLTPSTAISCAIRILRGRDHQELDGIDVSVTSADALASAAMRMLPPLLQKEEWIEVVIRL